MGHIRLGTLPRTRRWRDIVAHLSNGADVEAIAAGSARAAQTALNNASSDPAFLDAVSLLMRLPLAARSPDYVAEMRELGLPLPDEPGLLDLSAALSSALDAGVRRGRTDLGEMAQMALLESIVGAVSAQLPSLFEPEPAEVRTALGRLASGDRFAGLARDFFGRLTHRCLDYYLSRELVNHIGPGARFPTDADRSAFDQALAQHCREASRIVEAYAGGWFGKTVYQGDGLTPEKIERFARYAFRKIRTELGKRQDGA